MRILDAAGIISRLRTAASYTVTRRAKATYVDGVVVPGATSTFTIAAVVASTSGRDLKRLPEGRSSTDMQTIYTPTTLYVGAQNGNYESDLVSLNGDQWEVQFADVWPSATGADGYCQAIVQRPNVGTQP